MALLFNHPLAGGLKATINTSFEAMSHISNMDLSNADSLNTFLEKSLSRENLDPLTVYSCFTAVRGLIDLGKFEVAEERSRELAASPRMKSMQSDLYSFLLDTRRQLRYARSLAPVHQILAEEYRDRLESYPRGNVSPSILNERIPRLDFYPREEVRSQLREEWETRTTGRLHLSFWKDFLELESFASSSAKVHIPSAQGYMPQLVQAVDSDEMGLTIVQFLQQAIDMDDPDMQEIFLQACQTLAQRDDLPETRNLIEVMRLRIDMRQGKHLEIEPRVANISFPGGKTQEAGVVLQYYLAGGETGQLKSYLQRLPGNILFDPDLILWSAVALKRAGLAEEAPLADAELQRITQKRMARLFATPNRSDLFTLFLALESGPGVELISEEWVAGFRKRVPQPLKHAFEMLWAYANQDWENTALYAGKWIDSKPDYYDFYYYLGTANYHLGETDEALEALTTFTRFSGDSRHRPSAFAMLSELKTGRE
jgi:hypothetical protein